eukprot:TRINITY_DN6837_c0_g1_i1.p1 TRINITY_DN6837_c0_g1~~TRINITY_DN6837_c0_g1_i1.p1  ORF type:complete len:115 (+),score=28.21 TRINITY_DN6837_c0_g1_i1:74-418(+)
MFVRSQNPILTPNAFTKETDSLQSKISPTTLLSLREKYVAQSQVSMQQQSKLDKSIDSGRLPSFLSFGQHSGSFTASISSQLGPLDFQDLSNVSGNGSHDGNLSGLQTEHHTPS